MAYRDRGLICGAVISLITLAGCGGYWFRQRTRAAANEAPGREEPFTPAKAA